MQPQNHFRYGYTEEALKQEYGDAAMHFEKGRTFQTLLPKDIAAVPVILGVMIVSLALLDLFLPVASKNPKIRLLKLITPKNIRYTPAVLLGFGSAANFAMGERNVTGIAAAIFFAALAAKEFKKTSAVAYGVGLLWQTYQALLRKDPLLDAMYKIAGGKEKFEALPLIEVTENSDQKLSKLIDNMDWNALGGPLSRMKTADGRNILIIKALSLEDSSGLMGLASNGSKTKAKIALVERLDPLDATKTISNLSERGDRIFFAVIKILSFDTTSFPSKYLGHSAGPHGSYKSEMLSEISAEMANEFYAQQNLPKIETV